MGYYCIMEGDKECDGCGDCMKWWFGDDDWLPQLPDEEEEEEEDEESE